MKTTYIKQISACLLLAGLQACASAEQELPEATTPNELMTITARQANDPTSRIGYTDHANGGVTLTWSEGDSFFLYGSNGYPNGFTLVGTGGSASGEFTGTKPEGESYEALYPYSESNKLTKQEYYVMNVTKQRQTENNNMDHLSAYTFMTGDVTFEDGNASVVFEHKTLIMKFVLTVPEAVSSLTPTGFNLTTQSENNIFFYDQKLDGTFQTYGNQVSMYLSDITPVENKITLYMAMFPFTAKSGDTLYFTLENGSAPFYRKTITLESEISFVAGKRYTMEATLTENGD